MKAMTLIYKTIKSKHPYAKFALISLDRPAARNALSLDLVQSLAQTLNNIRDDDSIRAIIINSTSKVFCAGADLTERRTMSPPQVSDFLNLMRKTFTALENAPVPTLSVVEGFALGGGLELALCTDVRVLGDEARVGLPETKLGIIPGAGGTQRLTRLIGPSRAKDMIFAARIVSSETAESLGLGIRSSTPLDTAVQLCEEYVKQSPVAQKQAKMAIMKEGALEEGLDYERACYDECLKSPDRDEGLRAFKEKRAPVYGVPKL